jgi:serine/tyrosine/threonine adenylyltransferase
LSQWQQRVASEPQAAAERARAMRLENPAVIARNHRVQAALRAAEQGDYAPFRKLLGVLQRPYEDPQSSDFTQPPADSERVLQTFCGT